MALLYMPSQVILAPEALRTVLAQEVFAARVNHQVAPHILARVETALAVLTLVPLFLGSSRGAFASVGTQVLEQQGGAGIWPQTHLAGEVTTMCRVQSLMPSEAQLGVVTLAALGTAESLLVWVMCVQVILEVVFAVEHFLAVATLVGLLRGVCSHVAVETNLHALLY